MMIEDVKRQLYHSKVMSTIWPYEISGGRHRQDQAIGRLGDWEIKRLGVAITISYLIKLTFKVSRN